jgi:hypothetical protein
VINEGEIGRGTVAGYWSALLAVNLAPITASLLLLALAPNKTIPSWASETTDHFDNHPTSFRYDFVHFLLARMLAAWSGALLGHLIRKRRATAPLNRA